MDDYTHCPVCGVNPWNGSDGAYGVCSSCQAAGDIAAATKPLPRSHQHYYRRDGYCSCGRKRGK